MMKNDIYQMRAEIFKVLGHPTRLKLLDLLKEGEKCVCEICPEMEMEQPNISQHLALLKERGIVDSRKEGLKVYYWIVNKEIFKVIDCVNKVIKKRLSTVKSMLSSIAE